jgi:hypothetical protein
MTIVVPKSITAGDLLHLLAMIKGVIINLRGEASEDHQPIHLPVPHIGGLHQETIAQGENNLLAEKKEILCSTHPLIVMMV